jgi:hypothetical protein
MPSALLFFLLGLNDMTSPSWSAREAATQRAAWVAPLLRDTGDLEADHRLHLARERWGAAAWIADHGRIRLQVWMGLEKRFGRGRIDFAQTVPTHPEFDGLGLAYWEWMPHYAAWCRLRCLSCAGTIAYADMERAWNTAHWIDTPEPEYMPQEP